MCSSCMLLSSCRVIEDVQGMRPVHDIDFVRINCKPLLESMKEEAAAWLRGLAGIMREQEGPVKQVRDPWGKQQ